MRFYSAMIRIAGDQNHQTPREHMPAPELRVLQAIHGLDAVVQIKEQGGHQRTPQAEVREYLERTYGHTKVGIDSDRGPVLSKVFPSWPHAELPTNARDFIDPMFFAEKTVPEASRDKREQAEGDSKPVSRNTYWVVEGSGELGMTEKGSHLPEGVSVINKDTWEKLQKEQEQKDPDDSFME